MMVFIGKVAFLNPLKHNDGMKKPSASVPSRLVSWARRHPYWTAFGLGNCYYGIVISWMFTIRTAEIAQGLAVYIVALSAGLIMTTSFAMGFVVFIWLYRRLKLTLLQPRALWLVPSAWIVSEYARSVLFSITSLGPGGRVGPYWAFGTFGYYLGESPLSYIARFGGVYLLSAVAVALFVAGYQSWRKRNWLPFLPVIISAILLSGLGLGIYRPTDGQVRTVAAVRMGPQDSLQQNNTLSRTSLNELPQHTVDVLVLPEYSHYWESDPAADSQAIEAVLRRPDGLVINSRKGVNPASGDMYNLLSFQSAKAEVRNEQIKWFVVPAGEYVPYIYQVVLAYAGHAELLRNFESQKSVTRGETHEAPYKYEGVSYGALACSGVVAPEFYRSLSAQGAEVLTNSAALNTLGVSALFHLEAESMNRLNAIANARPFVQSAKGGPAYVYSQDGRLLAHNYAAESGIAVAEVQANHRQTLYTRLGDWAVLTAVLIILGGYGILWRKKLTSSVR